MVIVEDAKWRVGRKLGRTIYAMIGFEPNDSDIFIGIMDNKEYAELIVREHNSKAFA